MCSPMFKPLFVPWRFVSELELHTFFSQKDGRSETRSVHTGCVKYNYRCIKEDESIKIEITMEQTVGYCVLDLCDVPFMFPCWMEV
jgi:hypothetical protein